MINTNKYPNFSEQVEREEWNNDEPLLYYVVLRNVIVRDREKIKKKKMIRRKNYGRSFKDSKIIFHDLQLLTVLKLHLQNYES